MLGDEADDDQIERRDRFVESHCLLAASGGGLLPHVYLFREGRHLDVVWREPRTRGGEVRFHEPQGRVRVDAALFLDATSEFMRWVHDATVQKAPQLAAAVNAWLGAVRSANAARAVLQGYLRPWGVPSSRSALGDVESVLELPENWWAPGSLLDPGRFPIAVVFRALAPVLDTEDVLRLVARLRSSPANPNASRKLEELRRGLQPAAGDLPHDQGYLLAELVRRRLGNVDRHLDIEQLLASFGIGVHREALSDDEIEAATVWDDNHGPVVIVNECGHDNSWALRMTLAHELCHLLVDRLDAAPLLIASTPWAPPELERRANAFAAELLLPRAGVLRVLGNRARSGQLSSMAREALMNEFGVGETVCTRHVENRFRWGYDR